MQTTILIDAGGVLLDETESERIHAEVAVTVLSPLVAGYDIEAYWFDAREAVTCFVPSVYR